jgi:hypothetical protein
MMYAKESQTMATYILTAWTLMPVDILIHIYYKVILKQPDSIWVVYFMLCAPLTGAIFCTIWLIFRGGKMRYDTKVVSNG